MSFVVPEACTLPTAERPLRLAEINQLFTTAVRHVETISPTHARIQLSGPAGLEATVRDLTARETQCCSFFTFDVTPEPAAGDGTLTLDVQVPAQHADILASLAQRASTVATAAPNAA